MKNIFICLFLLLNCLTFGQGKKKRVLFLGNSYTYVNNLPQMIADIATSMGDTVIVDNNTPGGYTLQLHSTNSTSLNKIMSGNWDYVVLQEQSQLPSFPIADVEADVFPYARMLDSIISFYNPCAETIFYMTWGRKNGDASNCSFWPPVCTYSGMDSLLNLRYRMMADSNNAIVSPVGAVWKNIRENFPSIDLYQADASHPSVAGTYTAACSFYAAMFRKDPADITYNPALNSFDATAIRNAAKLIVYDSLSNWNIGSYDPFADFSYSETGPEQVSFSNNSLNSNTYQWNFGDGDTSQLANPVHQYAAPGIYVVSLIADRCNVKDTLSVTINLTPSGVQQQNNSRGSVYPNPAEDILIIAGNARGYYMYQIYDIAGKEVIAYFLTNSENRIDISSLPEGLYFLQIQLQNNTFERQKFIKAVKQ